MKKKISILGSTGSIGSTTLNVVDKFKSNFLINTLSANSNFSKINKQILKFKPKNFVISDYKIYLRIKKKYKNKKINIINEYKDLKKTSITNDISVAAIPGLAGLKPTIMFTKNSKKILLANKESIICGWQIIDSIAKKNKTKIIPIDSEHFSINQLIKHHNENDIKSIYITASGGPFLKLPMNKFKNIKIKDAIKHPKWSMGKKISIDSATLMNKILELVEAKKIFPFKNVKFKIIIHPQSLVHAIVKFKNGLVKLLYHEPNMIIPISNAIFDHKLKIENFIKNKKKYNNINDLQFYSVDKKRFPVIKLLPKLDDYKSTAIIINASNEILVDQFLKKRISFNSIIEYQFKVLKHKNYKKYAIQRPNNLKNIYLVDNWARSTTLNIIKNMKNKFLK